MSVVEYSRAYLRQLRQELEQKKREFEPQTYVFGTRHRRNMLKSGELQEESICAKFAHCKLSRYSVVAFFATASTTEETSVVQERGLRKLRPRIRFFDKTMRLFIAESGREEKDVLTRVLVNLINRRNQ